MDKIKKAAAENAMDKVLRKAHKRKEQMNKKILNKYFNHWRDLLPGLRRDDSAKKIQTNLRSHNARKKVKRLRLRNEKMRYLTLKLFGKYLDKRKIAFAKWLAEVERQKCEESAKIIQDFVDSHYRRIMKNKAQEKLRAMFRMHVIKQIKEALKNSSKISGDRGTNLFNTLEDIYIRRPYNKLLIALKWIGRIKQLKKIQPKILRALKHHWLPYYMRRWYTNSVGDFNRKLIFLQKWMKARLELLKKKAQLRKTQLLKKFLIKLVNDKHLLLRIPFKYWQKISQYNKLNDQTNLVQKMWRGSNSRKKTNKLLAQKRLKNLLKKSLNNKIADVVKDSNDRFAAPLRSALSKKDSPFEKRYCTNDIVDFANDELRNRYLLILTGKTGDRLSTLRRYFDRWRDLTNQRTKAAIKLQSSARGKLGRNKRKLMQRVRDTLYSLVLRYEKDDQSLKEAGFRKWVVRDYLIKCDQSSRTIQDFLQIKLGSILAKHFINFFERNAKKLAKRRINQVAKVDKLRKTLLRLGMRPFLNGLRNKDKYDKLRIIICKALNTMEGNVGK